MKRSDRKTMAELDDLAKSAPIAQGVDPGLRQEPVEPPPNFPRRGRYDYGAVIEVKRLVMFGETQWIWSTIVENRPEKFLVQFKDGTQLWLPKSEAGRMFR